MTTLHHGSPTSNWSWGYYQTDPMGCRLNSYCCTLGRWEKKKTQQHSGSNSHLLNQDLSTWLPVSLNWDSPAQTEHSTAWLPHQPCVAGYQSQAASTQAALAWGAPGLQFNGRWRHTRPCGSPVLRSCASTFKYFPYSNGHTTSNQIKGKKSPTHFTTFFFLIANKLSLD